MGLYGKFKDKVPDPSFGGGGDLPLGKWLLMQTITDEKGKPAVSKGREGTGKPQFRFGVRCIGAEPSVQASGALNRQVVPYPSEFVHKYQGGPEDLSERVTGLLYTLLIPTVEGEERKAALLDLIDAKGEELGVDETTYADFPEGVASLAALILAEKPATLLVKLREKDTKKDGKVTGKQIVIGQFEPDTPERRLKRGIIVFQPKDSTTEVAQEF